MYLYLHPLPLLLCEGSAAALAPRRELPPADYHVLMRIFDAGMLYQESTLLVEVCQCQGVVSTCFMPRSDPQLDTPALATSVLGGILLLLGTWLLSPGVTLDLPLYIPVRSIPLSPLPARSAAFAVAFVAEEEAEAREGCCAAGGNAQRQCLLL